MSTKMGMTAEQRRAERYQRLRDAIADGLSAAKRKGRYTQAELGKKLGVGHETVAKLLAAEPTKSTDDLLFQILDMSGLYLVRKRDLLDKEGEA